MENKIDSNMTMSGSVDVARDIQISPGMSTIYHVECIAADGTLRWEEDVPNTVVNVGLDDILDKYFKGSSYTGAFYVGLKSNGSIAAADTMASHSGWTELPMYDETTREVLTLGTVSSQSVDNSASKASFTINAGNTVGGAFVVTDNNISGANGTLYGVADFSTPRLVESGDTLNITVTLTAASA